MLARVFLIAACLLAGTRIQAQEAGSYPSRPVRVIVPFAPSGPADIVARLLAQKLGEQLGKQFYVENQPGAGGNLGMGAAARANPDGYTLVLVSSSYMVNPSLYPKVPYDQAKDFVPVTLPAYAPNVLVANPSLPVQSAQELAAQGQSRQVQLCVRGNGDHALPLRRAVQALARGRACTRAV